MGTRNSGNRLVFHASRKNQSRLGPSRIRPWNAGVMNSASIPAETCGWLQADWAQLVVHNESLNIHTFSSYCLRNY